MLYFADAPADTAFITFLGGVPADDVPQYWHRADGFDDRPIAQTESKHRVKFAREQVVAASAVPQQSANSNPTAPRLRGIKEQRAILQPKFILMFFIFSLLL